MPKKSNAKRKDGRVAVQIYLGKDAEGKRIYKTVYGKTDKEARKLADNIKAQIGKGLDVTSERSFGFWAEKWLASISLRSTPAALGEFKPSYPSQTPPLIAAKIRDNR